MSTFYITTAIDYANGSPHLGHAYEKVLADVVARSHRLCGEQVHLLTGLDEHGQKVQQTAQRLGVEPQKFVDGVAVEFQEMCKLLNISNDDYVRTTQPRHTHVVQAFLQALYDKGEIYRADYKGFYSTRQEQFVLEKDKVDGQWPEIFGEVTEITETAYFFRLAKYQPWLIDYLKEHPDFVYPRFRMNQVLEFLKEPLNDLCISRPRERLSWGIPLPFDENFVTYVWFDALTNYYSAVKDKGLWPADFHIIGKDIMVPPHAVYWPIMLQALGLPVPKALLVHGFWTMSGGKMSKSAGNTVKPLDVAAQYGVDAFRYFLIREMNVGQDSDFSLDLFLSRYNGELANDLGNLVSRLLNMTARYADSVVPAASVDEAPEQELRALWEATQPELIPLCQKFQFHLGLEKINLFVRGINRYAETRAPWKLAKSQDPDDRARLATSLATMAEGVRLSAAALAHVMPTVSAQILGLLGQPAISLWAGELAWQPGRLTGAKLADKAILFPRPQTEEKPPAK